MFNEGFDYVQALAAFRSNVHIRADKRGKATRAAIRFSRATQAAALAGWREHAARRASMGRTAQKALAALRNRLAAAALRSWRLTAAELAERRQEARTVLSSKGLKSGQLSRPNHFVFHAESLSCRVYKARIGSQTLAPGLQHMRSCQMPTKLQNVCRRSTGWGCASSATPPPSSASGGDGRPCKRSTGGCWAALWRG